MNFREIFKLETGEEINIRYPKMSDLLKLLNYINELIEENSYLILNKKLSLQEERDFLKQVLKEIKRKERVFLIASLKNKIVGTCEIRKMKGKKSHVGEFGISVKKEYRKKGIGKRLLKTAFSEAKNIKINLLQLSVFSNNKAAISFYKKEGFKECGRIPKALKFKNELVDEILMYREIQ
jgi:RimJ/RimL family protein N-acetyltransferase